MLDLAWEPAPGRLTVDLDASVIAFDSNGEKLEIVWYQHQSEFAGALQHTGDAKGDPGAAAYERVLVDLARMPENVYALVFTISSFHGHTFTDLSHAFCVVSDDMGRQIVHLRPHRHPAQHRGADGRSCGGSDRACGRCAPSASTTTSVR